MICYHNHDDCRIVMNCLVSMFLYILTSPNLWKDLDSPLNVWVSRDLLRGKRFGDAPWQLHQAARSKQLADEYWQEMLQMKKQDGEHRVALLQPPQKPEDQVAGCSWQGTTQLIAVIFECWNYHNSIMQKTVNQPAIKQKLCHKNHLRSPVKLVERYVAVPINGPWGGLCCGNCH